jgi:flagella synthesis protein FlgN
VKQREQLLQVIEQDVRRDCADYLALRGAMQELYQQLLERNCRQIDLLNEQITTLVEQVRARAGRRSKILAVFRLGGDSAAMQQLLSHYPRARSEHLQRVWQQLGQLVVQCKQLNERNGKLLAMHNDILDQLLGDGRDPQLYAPQFY